MKSLQMKTIEEILHNPSKFLFRPFLGSLILSLFFVVAEAEAEAAVKGLGHVLAKETGVKSLRASQRVKLGLNKSIVIDLPSDAYDILVANPFVADAVTRSARRIYLFGKAVGETNIFVFGAKGEQIASLDLYIERDVSGLEGYIRRFIPNSEVKIELLNDNVVITGTVETPLDAKRAGDLAAIFIEGGEATTNNYSSSGSSTSGNKIRKSQIINMLQIAGEDQVTLKVTVAEVSRQVMKQLGINLNFKGSITNGIKWASMSDAPFGLGAPISGSGADLETPFLKAHLRAMEQAGVMKTLAEPTLTAVSGQKALFRVGGEFNIVRNVSTSSDSGSNQTSTSVDQIEYGIGLEFRPVVLSAGRISLKIRTSVSEPTGEGAATLNSQAGKQGSSIISLRKRLADTTVELPSGGSMMIAGLVRDDVRQIFNRIPGISKIPVLGALFRSRDFTRNETELVIIVTPYLSRPVARDALRKPDDNFNPATDIEANMFGKINRIYGIRKDRQKAARYHGVVGYIYE